ncbi:hypothetical protein [Microvirga rosea]|uniref:hypothetical protein n=1 Tax=Microvirga rosea TaxID=2715425 RepID=UPI001D0B947D|nr:hypothetical protein [Microvirga rosea]MCB8822723.1 hypothetical protein [Microvirga rosea]
MAAVAEEQSLFENEEWLVTPSGLEHKENGYFIERESLGARRGDGLWAWPLHMAEKTWCAMAPFAEAFSCAVAVHHVEADIDLARTFTIARREIAGWPHAPNAAAEDIPTLSAVLQNGVPKPIFVERRDAEKSNNDAAFSLSGASLRMREPEGLRSFSAHARFRSSRFDMSGASAFGWRAPNRIRRTGTKLVRMIQAAWNIR